MSAESGKEMRARGRVQEGMRVFGISGYIVLAESAKEALEAFKNSERWPDFKREKTQWYEDIVRSGELDVGEDEPNPWTPEKWVNVIAENEIEEIKMIGSVSDGRYLHR